KWAAVGIHLQHAVRLSEPSVVCPGRDPRASELARPSAARDGRRHHRLCLAHDTLQHSSLSRRPARHPARLLRGGRGRRRLRMAKALAHHAAAAAPDHRGEPDLEDDVRLHGVRRDLRHHAGRPWQRHVDGVVVHISRRLPAAVQRRSRRRVGVGDGADSRRGRRRLHTDGRAEARGVKPSRVRHALLTLANVGVITFLLLPLLPVVMSALQSEKALQSDLRALLPRQPTLANFELILSGGAHRGPIFQQVTCLPKSVERSPAAFMNSVAVAASVALLTLLFASFSAYTVARLRLAWVKALLSLSVASRLVPLIVLMVPLYVLFRRFRLFNFLRRVVLPRLGLLLPYPPFVPG